MWLEENLGERINLERADEAVATGADIVVTACPYCAVMLDDAVKARGREDALEVLDLARLLARARQPSGGRRHLEGDVPVQQP